MWDIKLEATNEQARQIKTHRPRQQYNSYQRERGWKLVKDKGNQIYGDGKRLDFGR